MEPLRTPNMNYSITQTTHYGNQSKKVDCIFLNLHADDGHLFLSHYPEFREKSENTHVFQKYLNLEADIGTRDLCHIAAKHLSSDTQLHSAVLDVRVPRGILDVGRWNEDRAIRDIIDYDKYPNIRNILVKMHTKAIDAIQELFADLSKNGVWIDIHSMAPFNPDPSRSDNSGPDPIKPTPETLSEYINVYTSLDKQGKRRRINLATQVTECPGEVLSDQRLLEIAQDCLNQAKYLHGTNDPHPMTEAITAAQLMKKYGRGLFIDVPKDYISDYPATWTAEYLTGLNLSRTKLTQMAHTIAQSVALRLAK